MIESAFNQLFRPNLRVRSIVATISIQNPCRYLILYSKSMSEFEYKIELISKIVKLDQKSLNLIKKIEKDDQN